MFTRIRAKYHHVSRQDFPGQTNTTLSVIEVVNHEHVFLFRLTERNVSNEVDERKVSTSPEPLYDVPLKMFA